MIIQIVSLAVVLATQFYSGWCISPFEFKQHDHSSGQPIKLQINIPAYDNFTTSLETVGEAIQLRRLLATLYDKDNNELIYFKIGNNNTLELVQSPLLFGPRFSDKMRITAQRHHNYHPMCVYTSMSPFVAATLDMCSGLQGYIEHGRYVSYIQPVKLKYSNKFQHVIITEMNLDGQNDTELAPVMEEISASDRHSRDKRQAFPQRWLEIYVLMDFDFTQNACVTKNSHCLRVFHNMLRVASYVFDRQLNIRLVVVNFEIFSKEDNERYGLGVYKSNIDAKSFEEGIGAITNATNIARLKAEGDFDVLLILTATNINKWSEKLGFAQLDRVCAESWNYAVADVRSLRHGILIIIHELLHTLGADHCGRQIMGGTCDGCTTYIDLCTIDQLRATLPLHRCLDNFSKIVKRTKNCGNTIVDEGEECEYIFEDNFCCTWNCKKHPGAICASGGCCDLKTCGIISKGAICRQYVPGKSCQAKCNGNSGECPNDDGSCHKVEWTSWTQWLPCECRTASTKQIRNRTCSYPFKYQEGLVCTEDADQNRQCQAVPGCRDGNWGDWHSWGRCECFGDVLQHRYKQCDDPTPTNGGMNCVGNAPKESRACVTDECDEPGKLTASGVTQANTRPEDITSKTPLTQPRTTVPRVIVTEPDPATFKTGVKSTTLPAGLLPEASTDVNVLVSVSSNLTIVGAVIGGLLLLTGLAVASKKLLSCARKSKKKRKRKSHGSQESTLMVHPHGLMASVIGLQTSQSRIMRSQASGSAMKIPATETSAIHLRPASAALAPLSRKLSTAEQSFLQLGTATASAAHVPLSAAATQRSSIARGAKASWIWQYDQDRQLERRVRTDNKKSRKSSKKGKTKHRE